jgi:hypothetical protein
MKKLDDEGRSLRNAAIQGLMLVLVAGSAAVELFLVLQPRPASFPASLLYDLPVAVCAGAVGAIALWSRGNRLLLMAAVGIAVLIVAVSGAASFTFRFLPNAPFPLVFAASLVLLWLAVGRSAPFGSGKAGGSSGVSPIEGAVRVVQGGVLLLSSAVFIPLGLWVGAIMLDDFIRNYEQAFTYRRLLDLLVPFSAVPFGLACLRRYRRIQKMPRADSLSSPNTGAPSGDGQRA